MVCILLCNTYQDEKRERKKNPIDDGRHNKTGGKKSSNWRTDRGGLMRGMLVGVAVAS